MPHTEIPQLAQLPPAYLARMDRRFTAKVRRVPHTGCHIWTGCISDQGYGIISVSGPFGHRQIATHRWAWERDNGPILDGKLIRHLCHNKRCVHPKHLAPGDQALNARDMTQDGKGNSRLTDKEAQVAMGLALLGWKQREIAAEMGASQSLIGHIVAGIRRQNAIDALDPASAE